MINLTTFIGNVYFYIKDGVVFDILAYDNGDSCANKGVSGTPNNKEIQVPSITVQHSSATESTTLYFLSLIKDGDKVSDGIFYKHNDGESSDMTMSQYYESLCLEEIKKAIAIRPTYEFNDFNENLTILGIPLYMISGQGYTVTGITQITFNETNFNNWKKEVVQDQAYTAAQNVANRFGYKVTSAKSSLKVANK